MSPKQTRTGRSRAFASSMAIPGRVKAGALGLLHPVQHIARTGARLGVVQNADSVGWMLI